MPDLEWKAARHSFSRILLLLPPDGCYEKERENERRERKKESERGVEPRARSAVVTQTPPPPPPPRPRIVCRAVLRVVVGHDVVVAVPCRRVSSSRGVGCMAWLGSSRTCSTRTRCRGRASSTSTSTRRRRPRPGRWGSTHLDNIVVVGRRGATRQDPTSSHRDDSSEAAGWGVRFCRGVLLDDE